MSDTDLGFTLFFLYEHCFNYLWQRKPDQQPKMSQDICWLEHQDGKSSYRVLKSAVAWKCSYFSLLPDTSLKIRKSRADPHSPRLLVAQLECFIESAPIRYTCLYTNYIVATPLSSCTAKTSLKHFGSRTQRGITATCWQQVCGDFTMCCVMCCFIV